jgi:hypothetical protein
MPLLLHRVRQQLAGFSMNNIEELVITALSCFSEHSQYVYIYELDQYIENAMTDELHVTMCVLICSLAQLGPDHFINGPEHIANWCKNTFL